MLRALSAVLLFALVGCKSEPTPDVPPAQVDAPAATGPGCWSREACAGACLVDAPHACVALATYQAHQLGAPAPNEPAAPLDRACAKGDAEACVRRLGALDEDDPDRAAAREEARAAVAAACEAGDGDGCYQGAALDPDAETADQIARYVKACGFGSTDACHGVLTYALGVRLTREESVLPEGAEGRARATLAKRCAERDGMACFSLALHGDDPGRAESRAAAIFDARCAAGHPPSCALLGSLRRDLERDASGAIAAYRRGCQAGLREACARSVPPDPRLSGAFTVKRHVVFEGCEGEAADSLTPMARFRLVPTAPPERPHLEVLRCESSDDGSCDEVFSLSERAGAGWGPGYDAVYSGDPCFAATLTRSAVRATDGGVELVIETFITPDGDHPELCARVRAHQTEGLLCRAREVVTGVRE